MAVIYKNLIIGSGPAAVAALMALNNSNKVAIVNGEYKGSKHIKSAHRKITYNLKNKKEGFCSDIFISKNKEKIFSISKIGGLANFWGQGFDFVNYKKLYNKKIFKNENEYKNIIKKIYFFFKIDFYKGSYYKLTNNINLFPSPIVKENIIKKELHLKTLKNTYEFLKKKIAITEYNSRVKKIVLNKKIFEIILADSKKIYSTNIILSAGVIGNSKILFNSNSSIKKITFKDDCPWVVFTFGMCQKFKKFIRNSYSTIGKDVKNSVFLSVYNLRRINIHFLLYYIFGINFPNFLKKIKFRFDYFNVFQIWSKYTIVKIHLSRNNTYREEAIYESASKKKLKKILKTLKEKKIFKLLCSTTRAGEGFHYHNMSIEIDNVKKKFLINEYLKTIYNKNIICVDASDAKNISPGPFTASEMAIAYKKIKLFFKNNQNH